MADNKEAGWTKIGFNQPVKDILEYGPSLQISIGAVPHIKPVMETVWALIDTGAHGTGISPEIAKRLALQPICHGTIQEAGREPIIAAVYRVRLSLKPLPDVDFEVTGLPHLRGPHHVLIGRDFLAGARIGVDFMTGKTALQFNLGTWPPASLSA